MGTIRENFEDLVPKLNNQNLELICNDVLEIESLLQSSLSEEPELESAILVLQEIVNTLKEEMESVKNLNEIPLRKEISIFAHLNYLEYLMSEFVDSSDEDEFFDEEFFRNSDQDEEAWNEGGDCCGGHSCHEKKHSSLINLDFLNK